MRYPVVLHTDDGTRYGVTVPDLPGCFSAGDTLDEALENAAIAIDAHVELMVEDHEDVPLPQAIQSHQGNPDYENGTWALVEVDLTPYLGGSERFNVTLDRFLVNKIDKLVTSDPHYKSRSGLLAEGALRILREHTAAA